MMMQRYFGIACLGLFFASCGNQVLFEQNSKVEDANWRSANPAIFELEVEDTLTAYDFYINVRNTGSYRFSNLYLFIQTDFPNGKSIRDTVECLMATPEGEWIGTGVGDLRDQSILFKQSGNLPLKGKNLFEMVQAMRQDPLPGIADIGLRIEKAGSAQ
jgi:gliding motility-associated lipoprotein GldH